MLLKLHLGCEESGSDQCSAAVMGDLLELSPLGCWWALTKNLFPRLISLVGRPDLGKLLDVPNIGIMGAAVLLGTFSVADIFVGFHCSVPCFSPISDLWRQSLSPNGLVLLWCTDRFVSFQILSTEVSRGGLKPSSRNNSKTMKKKVELTS